MIVNDFVKFPLKIILTVSYQQQKQDLKTLDEKIGKYTKSISEKQERVKFIESQLKKDLNELPLPILQAQHDALTESINKLQSRADAMKQRDGPTVCFNLRSVLN